jgi:uncharacterized Zn-finger protein
MIVHDQNGSAFASIQKKLKAQYLHGAHRTWLLSGSFRAEHHWRHEKMHWSVMDIQCLLPRKFNCTKQFDRRDHWRDRLKTHLKKSNSRRSEKCGKEENGLGIAGDLDSAVERWGNGPRRGEV